MLLHCLKFELLIIWIFLISDGSSDFAGDLKKIVKRHYCDKPCTFNHPEVTSKTIEFLPKDCYTVCAILTFNSNLDLSESQLADGLKSLTYLSGSMKIENSNLTNLNFFTKNKISGGFDFACDSGEISIQNNSMLEDVSMLKKFHVWGGVTRECPFQMVNNPKLDTTEVCKMNSFEEWIGIRTSGNKKDCGCFGGLISSSEAIKSLENCTNLYGGLKFQNFSETGNSKISSTLLSLENLRGNLEIQNTSFEDLSFLRNLKKIQSIKPSNGENVIINILGNLEMKKLGLESLEDFFDFQSDDTIVNFENLHPDFCLSIDEVYVLLSRYIKIKNIHAKFCESSERKTKLGHKVCKFESCESLEEYCQVIFGDIIIDSYDGKFLWKLYDVVAIFGSLRIQYTKLDALNFLHKLRYIGNLNDTMPAVLIRSNKYLKSAKLPNLLYVISKSGKYVEIQDNPVLFDNNQDCLMYRITYQTNLKVKNENCDRTVYKVSKISSNHRGIMGLIGFSLNFCFVLKKVFS